MEKFELKMIKNAASFRQKRCVNPDELTFFLFSKKTLREEQSTGFYFTDGDTELLLPRMGEGVRGVQQSSGAYVRVSDMLYVRIYSRDGEVRLERHKMSYQTKNWPMLVLQKECIGETEEVTEAKPASKYLKKRVAEVTRKSESEVAAMRLTKEEARAMIKNAPKESECQPDGYTTLNFVRAIRIDMEGKEKTLDIFVINKKAEVGYYCITLSGRLQMFLTNNRLRYAVVGEKEGILKVEFSDRQFPFSMKVTYEKNSGRVRINNTQLSRYLIEGGYAEQHGGKYVGEWAEIRETAAGVAGYIKPRGEEKKEKVRVEPEKPKSKYEVGKLYTYDHSDYTNLCLCYRVKKDEAWMVEVDSGASSDSAWFHYVTPGWESDRMQEARWIDGEDYMELQLRMAIARLAEGRASIYTLNREEPVGGLEIEEVLNVWQKFRHDHNVRSI